MQYRCSCGRVLGTTTSPNHLRCPGCARVFLNPQTSTPSPQASSAQSSANEYWTTIPSAPSQSTTRIPVIALGITLGAVALALLTTIAYWGYGKLKNELNFGSLDSSKGTGKVQDFDATLKKFRAEKVPTSFAELESTYRARPGIDKTSQWLQLLAVAGSLDLDDKKMLRTNPNFGTIEVGITPAEYATLDRIHERHTGVAGLVQNLMDQAPFVVNYPILHSVADFDRLPEIRSAEKLQRLMVFDALHYASNGDNSTALSRISASLRIAGTLDQYPNDIAQVFRYSMVLNTKKAIVHLLQSKSLEESQLASLYRDLVNVQSSDNSRACLAGNLVVGLAGYENPEATLRHLLNVSIQKVWDEETALADLRQNIEFDRAYFVTKMFERLLALDDRAKLQQLELRERNDSTDARLVRLASLSMNPLDKSNSFRWALAFEVEATRTLIAIEAFRGKNSALPSSLNSLVPHYLQVLPVDHFGDSHLQYEPQPDRYSIFSLAEKQVAQDESWKYFPKIWLRTTVWVGNSASKSPNPYPTLPADSADAKYLRELDKRVRENAEKSTQMMREYEAKERERNKR